MLEPDTILLSSKPRRRMLLWAAVIGCPFVLVFAWLGYKWYLDREYRAAVEEADRLDPGWRLAELEAARAEIPDGENAALQVLAARRLLPAARLLPADWLLPPPAGGPSLEEKLNRLPANEELDPALSQRLTGDLRKYSLAVQAARKVADMPRGRYVIAWTADAIMTPLFHAEDARFVAFLLRLDSIKRIHDGDVNGSLESCRAILNTARSLGDEPTVASWSRLFPQKAAIRSLERALAQGMASESSLEELQRLLEDEADQPLVLIATRAERAIIHQFLEYVEAGGNSSIGLVSRTGSKNVDEFLDRGNARGCHAAYLRYLNQCVEMAKLSPEEQVERLRRFDLRPPENVPRLLVPTAGSVDFEWLAKSFHAGLAFLRCAIVAVAVERYRLANGRWPERLDDLVPAYLSKIPIDPFDGQPLRFRRLKDGVIIYTVGEDQKDDGGKRVRIKAGAPDADIGFQLWDAERRRQAPKKE